MFETFILPIIIFAVIGVLAGILLTVASKVFEVKVDERIEKISDALPQANCGACGFAGCADYADAVVSKGAATNMCKPGGSPVAEKIAAVMGVEAASITPEAAVIHCQGNCNATSKKYEFDGVKSCVAVNRFYSGDGFCSYGCIGLGDCAEVCSENAISIKNGIACIDKSKCIACGKCVKTCPNSLISIHPIKNHIDVKCSSKDNGKMTKTFCKNGCIGCKICEKKCENDAIHVVDFHAVIDYSKCTGCGVCLEACPTGAIASCEK